MENLSSVGEPIPQHGIHSSSLPNKTNYRKYALGFSS